jgi:hypothetical protein
MTTNDDGLIPEGRLLAEVHKGELRECVSGERSYVRLDLTLLAPECVKDRHLFDALTGAGRARFANFADACGLPTPERDEDIPYFLRAIQGKRVLVDVKVSSHDKMKYNVVSRYWSIQ